MHAEYARALQCLEEGHFTDAVQSMRRVLAAMPTFAAGMELLAMALAQLGELDEARGWFERAARMQSGSAGAWINLGNICLECGDATAADAAFKQARALGADDVPWFLGYGLSLLGQARFVEARELLQAAFAREPHAADVRLALAQCLAELEEYEALGACLEGLQQATLNRTQRQVLAWLLAQAGNDEAAECLYRNLLEVGDCAEARVPFALLLERLNRVQEADEVLRGIGADSAGIDQPMLALATARVLRRQGQYGEAINRLSAALQPARQPSMQAQLQYELARNHDRIGEVDETMGALHAAHAAAALAFGQRWPDARAPAVLDWLQQRLHEPLQQACATTGVEPRGVQDPIFLVGFPRSGTTLLERILAAHTQLDVLEERPALERVIAALRCSDAWCGEDLGAALSSLGTGRIDAARQHYWDEVSRHVVARGRLVDKYPLTMTRLPYAACLFPQADWLLLLRHPCDCVLSCYMQAFGTNGGALAFSSLESTAQTYATIMQWWHEQLALAPVRLHVLRYEDLVADLPRCLAALMDFLGLPVQPSQFAFHAHASARSSRITTPSYAQVVQPLNDRAVGRWRAYRGHFSEQTLALLAPWVERFGYTLD